MRGLRERRHRRPGSLAIQASTDKPIKVAGWNVGLDDADINTIAARNAAFDGVDLWGISEVNRETAWATWRPPP